MHEPFTSQIFKMLAALEPPKKKAKRDQRGQKKLIAVK